MGVLPKGGARKKDLTEEFLRFYRGHPARGRMSTKGGLMASIKMSKAGLKAAITQMQREKKELRFIAESRGEQLRKAGLPVRFPRLAMKK